MGEREWGEGEREREGREAGGEKGRERDGSTRQNLIVKCFSEACSRSANEQN